MSLNNIELIDSYVHKVLSLDFRIQEDFLLDLEAKCAAEPSDENIRLSRIAARAMAGDAFSTIRMRALELLGQVGKRSDVFCPLNLRFDPDPAVRATAYETLGLLPGRRAVRIMSEGFRDPSEIVRRFAFESSPDACGHRVESLLRKHLQIEKAATPRFGILAALIQLGDVNCVPELKKLRDGPDFTASNLASRKLIDLGEEN